MSGRNGVTTGVGDLIRVFCNDAKWARLARANQLAEAFRVAYGIMVKRRACTCASKI